MPRKRIEDPFTKPEPNTVRLSERRQYTANALGFKAEHPLGFKAEISVALTDKAKGVELIEQVHAMFDTKLREIDGTTREVADGRKRELNVEFTPLVYVSSDPAHGENPALPFESNDDGEQQDGSASAPESVRSKRSAKLDRP